MLSVDNVFNNTQNAINAALAADARVGADGVTAWDSDYLGAGSLQLPNVLKSQPLIKQKLPHVTGNKWLLLAGLLGVSYFIWVK